MKEPINGIDIIAISAAVPKNKLNLYDLSSVFGNEEVQKIIKTTGVSSLRIAEKQTTSADLCYEAAINLIQKEKLNPKEIDGLIFVSQTPDHKLPQTSHILQHRLGLSERTFCLDIPLGCSGYIYGLFQANLLLNSKFCNTVLVLTGDTTSKLINEKDRSLKMLFGDAGAATLVKRGRKESIFKIYSDGSGANQLIVPAGGSRIPISNITSLITKDQNDNWRSEENLFMNGMEIFKFAMTKVPALFQDLCATTDLNQKEIDLVVLHQANLFMVEYLRKRMKLSKDQCPSLINDYGNTGPASIPLLLAHKGENLKRSNSLAKVVLIGFGVGLSWGGVTCDLSKTNFIKPVEI